MKIQSRLGVFDLTMIIISLVIGIGIFKTPSIVAQQAGTPFIFYLAWVTGGIVSILGALTFAEIGARSPLAGGFYKIFSNCYHPAFAFMINWSQLIALAGSAAAIALVGAEYIKPLLLPATMQGNVASRAIALTVLFVLFIINYAGIKMSARAQNVLSGLKISLILLLCIAAFAAKNDSIPVTTLVQPGSPLKALGLALIPIFYTWNGYQYTINFGADIKDPQRNIPYAIFSGISIIFILYLLINVAYCHVLGFEQLKSQEFIASAVARKIFGDAGFKITSILIFISVIGFLNTSLMSNPRVYYAMAEDKILPPVFKRVNSKTQTQEFALSFYFILVALFLIFLNTFEQILHNIIFINSVALIFGAFTIFILRRRSRGMSRSRIGTIAIIIVPTLFILFLLFVCVNMFISDLSAAMTGLVLILTGFPLYRLIRYLYHPD